MNRKAGMTKYMMMSLIRILIMAVVVLGIVLLFKSLLFSDLDVSQVKNGVLYSKIMYSPNGITYVDERTGRAYPGTIDLDKFTEETLENSINYTYERYISAKLTLLDDKKAEKKTIFLNKVWYNRWLPLSNKQFLGLGSTEKQETIVTIIYKENNEFKQGFLTITTLQPKS